MCGIVGHIAFEGQHRISPAQLGFLADTLAHRGPDDRGTFIDGNAALGMRRLSIIDVSGGHQPMVSADGRLAIVFNGEIYNYRELRARLAVDGHVFTTHSDTEVVLNAFRAWGPQALTQLNGMFAFLIWDKAQGTLFAARDRMGIKPLYYAIDGKRAMFASELTPMLRLGLFPAVLDHKAISDYLSYWYICEPRSIIEGVRQLPPGHYAILRGNDLKVVRYWHIPAEPEGNMPYAQAEEALDHLLRDAVKQHLVSDVPCGTFLSGGIDSGLVSAYAAQTLGTGKLQSFAIGFADKSYDETALAYQSAAKLGLALDVHMMEAVTPDLVTEIISAFDEPLGNASYVPTYVLARAARAKMKVVLTGDGGDELFGGYPTYQAPFHQSMWRRLPGGVRAAAKGLVNRLPVSHGRISLDYRLKQLMQGIDLDPARAHVSWRDVGPKSMQEKLWRADHWEAMDGHDTFSVAARYFKEARGLSVINQLMYTDLNTYLLNDHLRKVDRMTMAHGLEARVPFLDHRVVEMAMRLPPQYKVSPRKTKIILKGVARRYLPTAVVKGGKKGLTAPIAGWISGPLKDYVRDHLEGGILAELFEPAIVRGLCREHWDKRKDNSRLIWALLTLQVWHKHMKGVL